MEAIGEMNELLTTKMCSPVIVYGVVFVISVISVYLCREKLKRYNTGKMDNLHNMYMAQELKFLIILGVIMYGLCQYNKTELAWVFLIFPIIYVILQNTLLYVHVASAGISAPPEQQMVVQNYGVGMNAPLVGQGPTPPQLTSTPSPPREKPVMQQQQSQSDFSLPKLSNTQTSMGGGGFGGVGSGMDPSGFNL
jgi:hypothetical protein